MIVRNKFGFINVSAETIISLPSKKYAYFSIYNGFAYITNRLNNSVTKCTLLPNGTLVVCNLTGNNINGPRGIFITQNRAYIANEVGDTVVLCNIKSDGSFATPCNSVGSGFNAPIHLFVKDNYAFITNYGETAIN